MEAGRQIKRLIADGTVRPKIDRRYLLEDIVDALRYVDEGRPKGKVVITMGGSSATT